MSRLSRTVGLLLIAMTAILVMPTAAGIASSSAAQSSAVTSAPTASLTHLTALPGTSALLSRAYAAEKSEGIPSTAVLLPNFNAPPQVSNGIVHPGYSYAPAPMGLGDFGIQDKGGKNVGTVSYTSSVEASVTLNSVNPFYLASSSPDIFTMQLNTVLNHVTVLGNTSGAYWIQNVPVYTASTQTLSFEDNIWNFTAPGAAMQYNTLFSDDGNLVPGVFYYAIGPSFHMPTPFTVRLWNNATVLNLRPTMFFNYSVTASNGSTVSGSYDQVEFNSSAVNPPISAAAMPTFQINGQQTNAFGLLNDAEVMLGGPGGGSTTTLFGINATMSLYTMANGSSTYTPVPAAFDFGADTGETSEGIAETAQLGANPAAVLSEGPSLLVPLWGVVGAATSTLTQTVHLSPSNAWIFVSPTSTWNTSKAAWAPSSPTGTTVISLPAGTYSFRFILSDFKPVVLSVSGSGKHTSSVTLVSNTAYGVYTPLWAWNDGQLAAISQPGGSGTTSNPYVLNNVAVGPIDPLFGEFNDYYYPVFSGVFLANTNVSVAVDHMPSFAVNYVLPTEALFSSFFGTPYGNNLGMQFYHARYVSVVNTAQITGWVFSGDSYISNILFWDSSWDLIAGNTFQVQSAAIILAGGGHTVVWGNTFTPATTTAAQPSRIQYGTTQVGIQSYESKDLIYNNQFTVPYPAWTPNFNLYTGAPTIYTDRWNVSVQPASAVRVVNGWALTGSILGLTWQGGNYWGNYGALGNPYGVLPFNDYGLITVGGDHHPLLPFVLHRIIFTETGILGSAAWAVTINGYTQVTSGTTIVFWEPNGLYAYSVTPPSGYHAHPKIGAASVSGAKVGVHIHFT